LPNEDGAKANEVEIDVATPIPEEESIVKFSTLDKFIASIQQEDQETEVTKHICKYFLQYIPNRGTRPILFWY